MNPSPIHNPDRYMVELRQILSQGRKRIGFDWRRCAQGYPR